MSALTEHAWPVVRLGELLASVGRREGVSLRDAEPMPIAPAVVEAGERAVGQWVVATCAWLGFEAEPIELAYRDLEASAASMVPAIVRLPGEVPAFLAIVAARGRDVIVLGPDHRRHHVRVDELRATLCASIEQEAAAALERLAAHVAPSRRARSRAALRRELCVDARVTGIYLLRMSPGAPAGRLLRNAGLARRLVTIVAGRVVQYAAFLASWWMLGRGALDGHLDRGWLIAWGLLLLTSHAMRVALVRAEGRLATDAGALLKQRLLLGALRIPSDQVRSEGAGQLLGRVLETDAVESLALGGGLLALEGSIELVAAPIVLWAGAGGAVHVAALALVCTVGAVLARGYYRRRLAWTDARVAMTNDLVETMVGHRTRIAQQPADEWNHGTDHELEQYVERSAAVDREDVRYRALIGRAWLLMAVAGLAPALVSGRGTAVGVALALGGILLARQALDKLTSAAVQLAAAAISFRQVSALYRAAAHRNETAIPSFAVRPGTAETVVEGHEVTFRYDDRRDPALRDVTLRIAPGEQILVEGPSGDGKSTLAAVLSGLRVPQQGVLLLGGLDRATLGIDGWRRRIATAPQFHENHVLAETFAFNLLMGRAWPPEPGDYAEAKAICDELGLEPLLRRMPAGLSQIVGETGWQLSHGEKSRLYIARALLQRSDLVIFDESFSALDPETVQRALSCVAARAGSLVVIAHP